MESYFFRNRRRDIFDQAIWGDNNTTWACREKIAGLDGNWSYHIKGGKLNSYLWSYSIEGYEENFSRLLKATKEIIDGYTNMYGKPVMKTDDEIFRQNSDYEGTGKGIKAEWDRGSYRINVVYYFEYAGKGSYELIVMIYAQPKDYK